MESVGIIIQARVGSTRLPGKIFLPLRKKPVLEHVIERCKQTGLKVIVATPINKEDDLIGEFCKGKNIVCSRGPEEDVLGRYYGCAKENNLDIIIRITSDCPLIEPSIIVKGLELFRKKQADYLSNTLTRNFPVGLDFEIFSFDALKKANAQAKKYFEREHVTPYIKENPEKFALIRMPHVKGFGGPNIRICIDTKEDYHLLKLIYKKFYKKGEIDTLKAIAYLQKHPKAKEMNRASAMEYYKRLLKQKARGLKMEIKR